jgi:HK97 family phage prohead protease
MSNKRIILSTSGVNRYGYRVLTSGIRLENFLKNPAMYFQHETSKHPIGTWKDVKVEGDELTAIPHFDEVTEQSRTAKALYDCGTLQAASIGFAVISTSDDPKLSLAGQKYETVMECDLWEASVVGIPANPEATVILNLNFNLDKKVGLLTLKPTTMSLKITALKLGLSETATQEEIDAAIDALYAERQTTILQLGIDKGIVNDDNAAIFLSAIASDPKGVKEYFSKTTPVVQVTVPVAAAPAPTTPTVAPKAAGQTLMQQMIQRGVQGQAPITNERLSWDCDEWRMKDPDGLLAMKQTDPARFTALMGNL